MSALKQITGIRDLAPQYDAMLCDAWGVIHNGVELFPGAAEALLKFRETRGPVVVLTNAPRPNTIIPPQLDRLGLPRDAYDGVVTSGDATRAEIEARLHLPAFRIGPEKDDPLFDGLDINFVALEEAAFIICTGMVDDQHETPDDYKELLQRAAALGLPMICANPDIVVNWGGRMIWCAGALAQIYEAFGARVIYGGKPHAPIYELAMRQIEKITGSPLERSRVVAIGDGLKTDIAGANVHDIDAVLVSGAGGIHAGTDDVSLEDRLSEAGVHAVAAMEQFAW